MIVRLISILAYLFYILTCVYVINGVHVFGDGFLHIFVILSIMSLFNRFVIDGLWGGHTNAWTISGTDEFRPCQIHARHTALKPQIIYWGFED